MVPQVVPGEWICSLKELQIHFRQKFQHQVISILDTLVEQNLLTYSLHEKNQGVRACLIQTEAFNLIMCIGILLLRHPIVRMFLSDPTKEIYHYSDMYLTIVAPFYFVLGLLAVYRTSIQSMQNGKAPFAACMIELVMRIAATVGLSGIIGYTSVCIASPMAWIGAYVLKSAFCVIGIVIYDSKIEMCQRFP